MFHKSGKHCVEFRAICEKRWLNMKKVAFYTVERPLYTASSFSEYKEDEIFDNNNTINNGNGTINEDKWVYAEDISIDYAFAQSVLYKVYGGTVQETGHKTKGHVCVTDSDRDNAKNNKGSLLYGELLPRGANKAFGVRHLHCSDAKVLFDLGMGAGKVAVQAFVQFRNLEYVYGVELSVGRYWYVLFIVVIVIVIVFFVLSRLSLPSTLHVSNPPTPLTLTPVISHPTFPLPLPSPPHLYPLFCPLFYSL